MDRLAPQRNVLQRSLSGVSHIALRHRRDDRKAEPVSAVVSPAVSTANRGDPFAELDSGYLSDRPDENEAFVAAQTRDNKARERELADAIDGIKALSAETEGIVDDTLYSVLEKVEVVNTTIVRLEELLQSINAAVAEAGQQSERVVNDVRQQLEQFTTLEPQQKLIAELQNQVTRSREIVQQQQKRLDAVRVKMEEWDLREQRWKARTSRRLRWLWGIFSLVVITLFVLSWVKRSHHDMVAVNGTVVENGTKLEPLLEPLAELQLERQHLPVGYTGRKSKVSVEKTLQMFDEL